jgi:hypothetical protein
MFRVRCRTSLPPSRKQFAKVRGVGGAMRRPMPKPSRMKI